MSDNKTVPGVLDGLLSGKKFENKSKKVNDKDEKKKDSYFDYERVTVSNSMNGNKYKLGASLELDTMQKLQYMLMTGSFSLKDVSKIPSFAINLLYDLSYEFNKNSINIFELSTDQIIDKIKLLDK